MNSERPLNPTIRILPNGTLFYPNERFNFDLPLNNNDTLWVPQGTPLPQEKAPGDHSSKQYSSWESQSDYSVFDHDTDEDYSPDSPYDSYSEEESSDSSALFHPEWPIEIEMSDAEDESDIEVFELIIIN